MVGDDVTVAPVIDNKSNLIPLPQPGQSSAVESVETRGVTTPTRVNVFRPDRRRAGDARRMEGRAGHWPAARFRKVR